MRKIIIYSFILMVIGFSSCQKFLDINHDPDAIEDVPLTLVLPAALSSPMYVLGGDGQIIGSYWAQHWTQSTNAPQFQGYDSWQITNATFDGRGYGALYSNALADLKYIKNKSRESENWSYFFIATVTEAYVYQVLVDLYDKVPFSEAILGAEGNITPKFDDGDFIYNAIADSINNALELDLNAATSEKPGNDDIIFHGDLNKWKAFANTLLLKIYLRQSIVNPGIYTKINLLTGPFLTEDASFDIFLDQSNKQNPIYASAEVQHKGNISMSRTLINYLINDMYGVPDIRDKRVDALAYRPEKVPEAHRALLQGDFNANSNDYTLEGETEPYYWGAEGIKYLSRPLLHYNDPLYYMSAAESYFLQAEVATHNNDDVTAKTFYESGVKAAFARLGLSSDDAQEILDNSSYAQWNSSNTQQEKFELIWMQKWVSMVNIQGVEAFIEHNRTNTPKEFNVNPNSDPVNWDDDYEKGWFTISVNNVTNGRYPRRLLVPQSEIDGNPNVPADLKTKKIYDPVWWDVEF